MSWLDRLLGRKQPTQPDEPPAAVTAAMINAAQANRASRRTFVVGMFGAVLTAATALGAPLVDDLLADPVSTPAQQIVEANDLRDDDLIDDAEFEQFVEDAIADALEPTLESDVGKAIHDVHELYSEQVITEAERDALIEGLVEPAYGSDLGRAVNDVNQLYADQVITEEQRDALIERLIEDTFDVDANADAGADGG